MKEACKCLACGHEWERGGKYPVRCPSCRSTTWNTTGAPVHTAPRSPTNWVPKTSKKRGVQTTPRCNGNRKPHTFEWQDLRVLKNLPLTSKPAFLQVCTVCGYHGKLARQKPKYKPKLSKEKYQRTSVKANAIRWKDHVPKVKPPKVPFTREQRSELAKQQWAKKRREALVQGAFYAK